MLQTSNLLFHSFSGDDYVPYVNAEHSLTKEVFVSVSLEVLSTPDQTVNNDDTHRLLANPSILYKTRAEYGWGIRLTWNCKL